MGRKQVIQIIQRKVSGNEKDTKKRRALFKNPIFWAIFIPFCIWMIYTNVVVVVTTYKIGFHNLPTAFDGFKIVQVSDLHNAEFGKENASLIRKVKEVQPDMIAITGDLIDSSRTDIEVALDCVEELSKLAPCYYVTGNHEAWVSQATYSSLEKGLQERGCVILRDTEVLLEKDDEYLSLTGIDDTEIAYRYRGVAMNMDAMAISALSTEGYFSILLSHRPEYYEVYQRTDANLILTGHAHGGQFRLPFVGGLVAPNQGLFPEYDSGVYREGDCAMVVSRGIGNSIIPVRFGNQPEIVVVELVKCEE